MGQQPQQGGPAHGVHLVPNLTLARSAPLQHIEVRKHMDADNIIAWEPPEASVPGLLGLPWRGPSP